MKKRESGVAEHKRIGKLDRALEPVDSALKTELIRQFQKLEGNFECYATAYNRACDQANCLWHDDCLRTCVA